jgi:3-hydroxybutyryl-CoA dehydrogenase
MNIAAIGSQERLEELNLVLSSAGLSFKRLESTKNIQEQVYDVIFDLNFDDRPGSISDYDKIPPACRLFLSSAKIQLEAAVPSKMWQQVLGINALPTFLKRNALEYCTLMADFDEVAISSLGWEQANKTASRVGLVSPRIVLMIINEAYYTLQEGTADRKDIDKGMKLGTAYPMGPFEWCEKIGIKDVYETLKALFDDTQDERYRICSLLKTEYLRHQAE